MTTDHVFVLLPSNHRMSAKELPPARGFAWARESIINRNVTAHFRKAEIG